MTEAERLQRKQERNREFMRKWRASLTDEQAAAFLAKRRVREVPRQREIRDSDPYYRAKARSCATQYYWANRDKQVAKQREYRERCKQMVFDHYGRFCSCCGEDELVFLTLDHVDGDGAAHRKSIAGRSGFSMYAWLVKNGFTENFQVLCFNCNAAKRTGSECPHRAIVRLRLLPGGHT